MATIIIPIIPDGTTRIVGLVGVNIDLSISQTLIEELRPYGDGRALLITDNGLVAGHYDASKRGQTAEDALLPIVGRSGVDNTAESFKTGKPTVFSNNGRICCIYPFFVGDNGVPWAILSSVQQSTVLASVNQLTRFTIILALAAVFVSAGIIYLIAASIAKPIVNISLTLKDISEG
jgi:methyl-accepting chemotaxis protein